MDDTTAPESTGTSGDDALARLIERSGRRARAPEEVERRVRAAVDAQWQQRRTRLRLRRAARLALVASVLAAVGTALVWNAGTPVVGPDAALVLAAAATVERVSGAVLMDDEPLADGTRVPAGAQLRTAADGRLALRMLGGASLRVDHASRVQLTGPGGAALLAGALYVDSQLHDGFVVLVRNVEVRDVGTQFDVRLEPKLEVGLREGAVTVTERGSGRLRAELVAMDGSGAVVELDDGDRVRRVTSADARWRWAENAAPPVDLDGMSSARYLAWVAHATGRELQCASEAAARRAMSTELGGRFRSVDLRDTIGEVLGLADLIEVEGQPGDLIVDVAP